jgi:hypothetical protein
MAERTGLEPATPGVTGRYSNQLNYRSGWGRRIVQGEAGACYAVFVTSIVGAEGLEPPTFAV